MNHPDRRAPPEHINCPFQVSVRPRRTERRGVSWLKVRHALELGVAQKYRRALSRLNLTARKPRCVALFPPVRRLAEERESDWQNSVLDEWAEQDDSGLVDEDVLTSRDFDPVFNLVWKLDGSILLALHERNAIRGYDARVWTRSGPSPSLSSHTPTFTRRSAQMASINTGTFIDENRFLAGDEEGYIYLWDLRNMDHRVKRFKGHASDVKNVSLCPNGKFMSSAFDGQILLWDVDESPNSNDGVTCTRSTRLMWDNSVYRICVTPDFQTLAVSFQDGNLMLVRELDLGHFEEDLPIDTLDEGALEEELDQPFLPTSTSLSQPFRRSRNRIEMYTSREEFQVPSSIQSSDSSRFLLVRAQGCLGAPDSLQLLDLNARSQVLDDICSDSKQWREGRWVGELPDMDEAAHDDDDTYRPSPHSGSTSLSRPASGAHVVGRTNGNILVDDWRAVMPHRIIARADEPSTSSVIRGPAICHSHGRLVPPLVASPYHRGVRFFSVDDVIERYEDTEGVSSFVEPWTPCLSLTNVHEKSVYVSAFSPTSYLLACGSCDGSISFVGNVV